MANERLSIVERAYRLRARALSYASDKPAVNLLLADLAEGIEQQADTIERLVAALEEALDKLFVLHFNMKDAAERQAAVDACNMATEALQFARNA